MNKTVINDKQRILKDPVIRFIISQAKKFLKPNKVYLFGSRSQGSEKSLSDYDFAIDAPRISHGTWAQFSGEVSEKAPTLHEIDLVWLNQDIREDFLIRIKTTGLVIYEKKRTKAS